MNPDDAAPRPAPEPEGAAPAEGGPRGALAGCLIALIIGAALLSALRFFYYQTPLGPALREMLPLPH
jgi:hypothetical protein